MECGCPVCRIHARTDHHASCAALSGAGHLDCLQLLLSVLPTAQRSTALPFARLCRADGRTPLHWAARNGRTQCVQWLLSPQAGLTGLTVDGLTSDGSTPLMLCCFGGSEECCRALIAHGADPFRGNHWGCDCSHWAAMSSLPTAPDICRLLHHEHGLSFCEPQKEGHTAVDKAALRGSTAVANWMLQELTDEQTTKARAVGEARGKPASVLAEAAGHMAVAALLTERGL
eukprot:TRINITY_DN10098_c0_g1_i1.p1 TRINITY_DN10098_c0_g1~~TRINITY_DN10098_c0_g1_i1.p1  ORF type:complete len:230 (-),score=55.18 TRINITY_DN10098_c0_g1_i1:309-998(-)